MRKWTTALIKWYVIKLEIKFSRVELQWILCISCGNEIGLWLFASFAHLSIAAQMFCYTQYSIALRWLCIEYRTAIDSTANRGARRRAQTSHTFYHKNFVCLKGSNWSQWTIFRPDHLPITHFFLFSVYVAYNNQTTFALELPYNVSFEPDVCKYKLNSE